MEPRTRSGQRRFSRNPRIKSFDQYLLRDPPPFSSRYIAWSSGLLDWKLADPKSHFAAWRLPRPYRATLRVVPVRSDTT
jgi:hypothetical protein